MNWREEWSSYFHFTRKDRIAVLVLATLILLALLLPRWVSRMAAGRTIAGDTSWIVLLGETPDSGKRGPKRDQVYASREEFTGPVMDGELFYFDPNTLDEPGWRRLGLRPKTIATIRHYLQKGGRFYKPADLGKIYGLAPGEFSRIAPYIRIEEAAGPQRYGTNIPYASLPFPRKENPGPVDINSADTTALIALPGIGSKLASRIIAFREKLGGFHSIAQVAEVYGIKDSVFAMIRPFLLCEKGRLAKLNINTATVEELKTHPYIRSLLARQLVAYRDQHGAFEKMEDLKKIFIVTDSIYNRIAPYVELK